MPLELQLQRTSGTVYGEIMRDSGVSLPNGRYIPGRDFVLELMNHGVAPIGSAQKILKDVHESPKYGDKDYIWTGIQFIQPGMVGYLLGCKYLLSSDGRPSEKAAKYTFNPWKELMNGHLMGTFFEGIWTGTNSSFRVMRYNPRKGVERVRDMYASFVNLPQALQDDFLGILESYPCNLSPHVDLRHQPHKMMMPNMDGYYPDVDDHLSRISEEIKSIIPEERQQDLFYVLNLLAFHSICVGKGGVVKKQIEDIVAYDVTTIPTHWEQGHLNPRVVAKKQTELSNLLTEEKIIHS